MSEVKAFCVVVFDSWKAPIIQRHLTASGFKGFDPIMGLPSGVAAWRIYTDELKLLSVIVKAANDEARTVTKEGLANAN